MLFLGAGDVEMLLQSTAAPHVLQLSDCTAAASSTADCCAASCCLAADGLQPLPGPTSLPGLPAAAPLELRMWLVLSAPLTLPPALLLPPPPLPLLISPVCKISSSSPRTDQRLADLMRTSATLPIRPGTGSNSTCTKVVCEFWCLDHHHECGIPSL